MIVVFGSINVDLTFRVDHQPVRGETVLCPSYLASPGGKGANQATAAARAGADIAMVGCVGDDGFAALAVDTMRASCVDTDAIATVAHPTACATISVDKGGENSIVVASGANLSTHAAQVPDSWLGPSTLLLMQMEVMLEENWALLERAHAKGTRTALNVAPAALVPDTALGQLDFLFVNNIEGAAIAAACGMEMGQPENLPHQLSNRYGLTCILTLGKAGAMLHGPSGGYAIPPLNISAIDTTGAGDTFVGYMAAELDCGLNAIEAARRASAAAALACTKEGAQIGIPYASEVDAVMRQLPAAEKRS
jgi:ribokinase